MSDIIPEKPIQIAFKFDPQDDIPRKRCTGPCQQVLPATPEIFGKDKTHNDGLRAHCKACRKVLRIPRREQERLYSLQWAKDHREHKREYDRRYIMEHREERKVYSRQYHINNKELEKERRRIYAAKHRDTIRAQERAYYQRNKKVYNDRKNRYRASRKEIERELNRKRRERNQDYIRHYRATHKELYAELGREYRKTEHGRMILRAHAHKRRARELAVPGTLTPQQVQQKLRQQHFRCYYCSLKFERAKGKYIYHLEHTVPLSRTEAVPRHDVNFVVLACPTCNLKKSNKLPHEWPEGGRLF